MSGQEASPSSSDKEGGSDTGSDRDIKIGDFVFDRDNDRSDPALVVNKPPKTAAEWNAYADMTVADDNPDYPAHAPVIVVSYRDEIADNQPELMSIDDPIPLRELHELGITHYSFPAPRLRVADPEIDDIDGIDGIDDIPVSTPDDETTATPEPDTESTDATATDQDAAVAATEKTPEEELQHQEQELQQFQEFLRDNGVRSEIEGGMVVAEKLGQRYEITLEGDVEGDGPYQDRLEQLVNEYPS